MVKNTIFGPDESEVSVQLTAGPEPTPQEQVTAGDVDAKIKDLKNIIEKIKINGGTPPVGAETLVLINPQYLENDPVALSQLNQQVVTTEKEASGLLLLEEAGKAVSQVVECVACATDVSPLGLGFLAEALGLPARPARENQGFPLPRLPVI